MRENSIEQGLMLTGQVLVAHPDLGDPHFHRTVILISAHQAEEGSLGVILNRPLGKTLGDLNPDFSYSTLAAVPVYEGGPVQDDELILAAWHWDTEENSFRLYFGIDESKARELQLMQPEMEFRAFLGYAGWTEGQLEEELTQQAWVVSPIEQQVLEHSDGEHCWKRLIVKVDPNLGFLTDIPDDPSLN